MLTDEQKSWVEEHLTRVRKSYTVGGVLASLVGAVFTIYTSFSNDSANQRRIDDALKNVDAKIEKLDQRSSDQIRLIWDQFPKERMELKQDIRYELEQKDRK